MQSGKQWIETYEGKNIVRGYAKWYGVDLICAIIELRMLGVKVDEEYEQNVRLSIEGNAEARRKKRLARKAAHEKARRDARYSDMDGTFAYIAGYTSAGFPYGVTWEELGEDPPWMDEEDMEKEK